MDLSVSIETANQELAELFNLFWAKLRDLNKSKRRNPNTQEKGNDNARIEDIVAEREGARTSSIIPSHGQDGSILAFGNVITNPRGNAHNISEALYQMPCANPNEVFRNEAVNRNINTQGNRLSTNFVQSGERNQLQSKHQTF